MLLRMLVILILSTEEDGRAAAAAAAVSRILIMQPHMPCQNLPGKKESHYYSKWINFKMNGTKI